jgi:serine protease
MFSSSVRPGTTAGLLAVAASLGFAVPAAAQDFVPGEVIVKYDTGTSRTQRTAVQAATGTGRPEPIGGGTRVLKVKDGETVGTTVRELRAEPDVEYAAPNVIARAAGFVPDDPGRSGTPGGWQKDQWHFLAGTGVDAPTAWANARAAKAPGGRGVTIAVLDTGVAYQNRRPFRRSPDFSRTRFVSGYDYVDRDRKPDDESGHGTFVAGIIAEATNNGIGVTGLAYGARILPVRVLDSENEGQASNIERGIRFAVRHEAKVINLSLEFDTSVRAAEIPGILEAIRDARRAGVIVVGASGNEGKRRVAYPARASSVLAVGATTENGCLADYSNGGTSLDIVAPGGGNDAVIPGDPNCKPLEEDGRDIVQIGYKRGTVRRFALRKEKGTSMAAPHVAAAAALVIATGVAGSDPSPSAVERRLKKTTRDLGTAGYDRRYGWGLVNAGAATAPVAR